MKKQKPIFEVKKLRVEREAVILYEVNWRVERGRRPLSARAQDLHLSSRSDKIPLLGLRA
jgi:hypothetical protein